MKLNRQFGISRNILAALAVSLSTVVALTACGSTSSSSSGQSSDGGKSTKAVSLNVYVGKFIPDPKGQQDFLNNLVSEFEKQNPDIKVKWTSWETASEEMSRLQTSLATKSGPDIFGLGSTFIPTAFATNGFHIFTKEDWDYLGGQSKFFPAQLTMSGPSADKSMAVPEYMFPYAMVYNKKMFQEAGITSPPKTWTEFVEDAKKLTNPAKDQWGTVIDPSDTTDPWKVGWFFTKQLGGDFLSPDFKQATINSAQSVTGLKFWFDWVTKYHIASPNGMSYKSTDTIRAFENGHAAMLIFQGTPLVPSLEKSPVKNDYAFAPMPTIPYGMDTLPAGGVPIGSYVAGQFDCIPNYVTGDRYKAALKWLKFVTEAQQQREMFKVYGYLPVNKDAYSDYAPLSTPVIKAFVDAENNSVPTPFTGAWGNLEIIYGGACSKIANEIATGSFKDGDIEKALEAANAQVQSALQQ